ncbi:MAG: tetratricopeptide repeat protein [Proteobacteria bacterium]|nr:tetratricopeptide repeat protein [Pseudomonadota bacterium]
MASKSSSTIIVAVIVAVVFGIGGYMVGSMSGSNGSGKVYQSAGDNVQQASSGGAIIKELLAKVKKSPEDVETTISLADAYFEAKQFEEAIRYYIIAIELDPNRPWGYNAIGLALHYMGNPLEALKYIELGIEHNPYHQQIWLTKGFILAYGMADRDGAKAAWEKAKAINPESRVGKAAGEYLVQISKQAGQ